GLVIAWRAPVPASGGPDQAGGADRGAVVERPDAAPSVVASEVVAIRIVKDPLIAEAPHVDKKDEELADYFAGGRTMAHFSGMHCGTPFEEDKPFLEVQRQLEKLKMRNDDYDTQVNQAPFGYFLMRFLATAQ